MKNKTVLPAVWMHALVITKRQPIFMTSQKVEMPNYEYFFTSKMVLHQFQNYKIVAAELRKRVAVLDYVDPSHQGGT